MPRSFRKDQKLTRRLFQNGLLLDKRSFIGYDTEQIPHLLLYGEDMSKQRERAFQKAKGRCATCRGAFVPGCWELDHIQGGTSGRCDCLHNLQCLHVLCHVNKHHRYPKFGSGRAQAIKQFNKVNQ